MQAATPPMNLPARFVIPAFRSALALALVALLIVPATLQGAPFTVAGLKIIPKAGDKSGNYAKFERHARQAAAAGAKVIVTSEGYLDGYLGNTRRRPDTTPAILLKSAETLEGPHVRKAAGLAKELGVLILFGFSE